MTHSLTPKALTLACALAVSAIASAQAADVQKDDAQKKAHVLDAVVVQDAADKNGETTLTAVELDMLPSFTGTVSDAFRGRSFVQYDAASRSGAQGAEIAPPLISIRGSRNYENAFLINGLSNSSLLNPAGMDVLGGPDATTSMDRQPSGDAQAIMLDTDLLESLTVLSENVSAEYGNFTGGVVNAKIRDAKMDRWHTSVKVRHTRDSWARMHFTDSQEGNLTPTSKDHLQKEFTKSWVGATLEGPLFDGKMGAMVSYQKTHSSAPVFVNTSSNKYVEKKSKRDKENFMLRLNTDKNQDFYISSALIYSPYESNVFWDNCRECERTIEGGGWNWSLNSVANLAFGKWINDFSLAVNEANWIGQSNVFYDWWTANPADPDQVSEYATWGSREGQQGSREQEQKTFNLKSIFELNPIETLGASHAIRLGLDARHSRVNYHMGAYTTFGHTTNDYLGNEPYWGSDVEGSKDNGIIAGEQWLNQKIEYADQNYKTNITELAVFAEDSVKIERFTFKPGIRLEWDDVTEDVNIAPRFNLEADVLNDQRFKVNVGYNRYYGDEVLYQVLRARQKSTGYYRTNYDEEWKPDPRATNNSGTVPNVDGLSTPYSDEYVVGASAYLFNDTVFKIQGVKRDYEDQIRDNPRKGGLTNEGKSHYKAITFGIEKAYDLGAFGRHYSEFGATYSKLKGNGPSMIDSWNWGESTMWAKDYVWIDDKKVAKTDMPASNFNSDWVLTYSHRAFFMDDRLRSTLFVRYETPSDGYYMRKSSRPRETIHNDGAAEFETIRNSAFFNVDFNVDYDLIKTVDSTLTVNVEVLNLFDRENDFNVNWVPNSGAVSNGNSTSMGRQFYLGMKYTY